MITQTRLCEVLKYDRDTGIFEWKIRVGNRTPGCIAGTPHPRDGRLIIGIDNKYYQSGRLAWLYENGFLPDGEVDHRDLDPRNNQLSNLRLATSAQNRRNVYRRKSNTSGYKGVSFSKYHGRFVAGIRVDCKRIHLGYFDTAEEASVIYNSAALKYHGDFAKLN